MRPTAVSVSLSDYPANEPSYKTPSWYATFTATAMTPATITLAVDRYDRHMPFFDGTVGSAGGIPLSVSQIGQASTLRDGTARHERMLRDRAFDAAEVSLSSYIVAKSRGMAFTAIPVFPRRLFSQSQIFVNVGAGIETPADLVGKRVGLQSFQTTLAVLAKGDLWFDYGVPLTELKWFLKDAETVDVDLPAAYDIHRLPADRDLGQALAAGEIDALFYSRTPGGDADRRRIRRLFADPKAEEAAYFARHGYWPIMHLVALTDEAVERVPTLPRDLLNAFGEADRLSAAYYEDPNWSRLPWARDALEEHEARLTDRPWPTGLAANRANLERFIEYSHDQGLIDRPLPVDALFHETVRDT